MLCNEKYPVKLYEKETGRHPMTAQMASESRARRTEWLQNGCNGFDLKRPVSNPMAFWTEQDVLQYINENNLPIASVYGEIMEDGGKLITTKCDRTGCMYCGFGCHLEKNGQGRFERLRETHPKIYDYIMKPTENGGLGYKSIIDWLNEHGNLNIRY